MIFAANLANYEKLLQQKYEVSSSIWHKGERGRQRENGLMMFLRETLPAAYGVASGEIMPFMGKKPSPQCDIIVYDRLRTPVFGRNQAVQQIPLEGVYAVIEVKSSIDAKAISDAKRKFARIKELPRCRNRVPLKKGFRRVFESMTSAADSLHYKVGGHCYAFICFSWAGFLLLIFFPAPAALGKFFSSPLLDDPGPLTVMGLLRGDVVNA